MSASRNETFQLRINPFLRVDLGNTRPTRLLLVASLVAALAGQVCLAEDWLQWGGPNRDFKVSSPGLAESWPEEGPPRLWSRPLGEGYSAIVAEDGVLYTMYRGSDPEAVEKETVIALDADTGRTKWEYRYDAPFPDKMDREFGPGPMSTPLITGARLFTIGSTGKLHSLEKETGKLLWARDIYTEFAMQRLGMKSNRGYSSSPIAYEDTLILPVGGSGQAVVAFDQKDGSLVWKSQDCEIAPSSPILIEIDGHQELVVLTASAIVGLNPKNGALFWSHPHKTDYGLNISTPLWGEDHLLFMSSAYGMGSRVVRLTRRQGETSPQEVWFSRRMQIHIGTAIRLGNIVYGSNGDFGPAFLMTVDVRTGEVLSRQRGMAKAQIIYADGKFLILDEDGTLALATPSPTGFKVISKAQVLNSVSRTVPTLVGTRLYLRDRNSMLALDLSP